MRIAYILTVILLVTGVETTAQKFSETREQVWLGYFNQTRFTSRSGVWLDLQLRLNDIVEQKSTSIARLGYTYYLSDAVRLTAGYGYITSYSLNGGTPDIPEHRPWQQIQWFEKKNKVGFSQYFRVEERFVRQASDAGLTDDYRFTWRFRYNFGVTIPINGEAGAPRTPFVFLNDELHVSAGKNVVNNYFDQNRLFAGIGYQFTKKLNAQLGYLYVFQQLPAGNHYVHINAARLFIFHNLDFR